MRPGDLRIEIKLYMVIALIAVLMTAITTVGIRSLYT
jgi:hypothetical protein